MFLILFQADSSVSNLDDLGPLHPHQLQRQAGVHNLEQLTQRQHLNCSQDRQTLQVSCCGDRCKIRFYVGFCKRVFERLFFERFL